MNKNIGRMVYYNDCGKIWRAGIVIEYNHAERRYRIHWITGKEHKSTWGRKHIKEGFYSIYPTTPDKSHL
jgi:hypothetical protein